MLPNIGGTVTPEVTLTHNASGRYEDRWVKLRVNPELENALPQRHRHAGSARAPRRRRLVVPDTATQHALESQGLNCLTYVDVNGDGTATYPFNPNGADLNCAGLTDPTGQVFGLMPHPEAFLSAYNHPDWPAAAALAKPSKKGGLQIFQNIVATPAAANLTGVETRQVAQGLTSLNNSR